jgi:zinc-binding dehydrogenase
LGASGGVGSHAVQLARAFGADVTGVCSTSKLDLLRALGADHVIDYTAEDFADGARRYHLILDIAGSSAPSRLRRALTATGTAVLVGGEDGGSAHADVRIPGCSSLYQAAQRIWSPRPKRSARRALSARRDWHSQLRRARTGSGEEGPRTSVTPFAATDSRRRAFARHDRFARHDDAMSSRCRRTRRSSLFYLLGALRRVTLELVPDLGEHVPVVPRRCRGKPALGRSDLCCHTL